MQQLVIDMRWQILIAVTGAVLISSGLVAYFLIRSLQNYSYEKYQEKLLKKMSTDPVVKDVDDQTQGLDEMQSREWYPQTPDETVSTQFGQASAAQMTDMNRWQMQPAYGGAWTSPDKPEKEALFNKQQPVNFDDPMDSPDIFSEEYKL